MKTTFRFLSLVTTACLLNFVLALVVVNTWPTGIGVAFAQSEIEGKVASEDKESTTVKSTTSSLLYEAYYSGTPLISIIPSSLTVVSNCIPFGSNTGRDFTGFIYRDLGAFSMDVGDKIRFDLGDLNDVDIRRNIFFAAASVNPDGSTCGLNTGTQGVKAVAWTQVVSDTQIPANPRGNTITGDFELTYLAESAFNFAGGGLIVGFQGSPPAEFKDTGCEQVLVATTCSDASENFYARFFVKPDLTLGLLDDITVGGSGIELGGMVIESANLTPVARPDMAGTNANQAVIIDVLFNDDVGDEPLTVTVGNGPTNGTTSQTACTSKTNCDVTYTPDTGFGGTDEFDYTLTDADGEDATATVTVTVDPSVAVAEPDPFFPDAPVIVLACADDPDCDSPFNWTFEALKTGGGGTLEVECCTFPAVRESLTTLSTRGDFYETRNLDVVAEVKVAAMGGSCVGVKRLLDEAAGLLVDDEVLESVLDFEILIPAWQRVYPNPLTYHTDTERNFLYIDDTSLGGADARADLEWGVCAVAFDGKPDGVSLTAENAFSVLGFETECDEDDLAFRPVTGGINIFPPQEDFPVVQTWSAECDRSRSGIRSSHVLFLLNDRIDIKLNGPKSTVSRPLGNLAREIRAEEANVRDLDMTPENMDYLDDLSDLLDTLLDAKDAVNAGNKAVRSRKNPVLPLDAFQPAIDLLDDFTCQALALPPRDNNARGLFTGRGLNARFMTCSYAQHPTSFDADKEGPGPDDCLINAEIERTILDLPGDKCPIVRP